MRSSEEQVEELRDRLVHMGRLVESAIDRGIRALVEDDAHLAQQVLENESRVNQMEMEIDEMAVQLFAAEPSARVDLQSIKTTIRINSDLERMGDLAVGIAERALGTIPEPRPKAIANIPRAAERVASMVRSCLDAFFKKDAQLARSALAFDDVVEDLRVGVYDEMARFIRENPQGTASALNLIFVARNLERIADHATNIAEDVLFLVEGKDENRRRGPEMGRAKKAHGGDGIAPF